MYQKTGTLRQSREDYLTDGESGITEAAHAIATLAITMANSPPKQVLLFAFSPHAGYGQGSMTRLRHIILPRQSGWAISLCATTEDGSSIEAHRK